MVLDDVGYVELNIESVEDSNSEPDVSPGYEADGGGAGPPEGTVLLLTILPCNAKIHLTIKTLILQQLLS